VDDEVIGTGGRERLEKPERVHHHEVHVQRKRRELAHRLDQNRTEREVGYELPVHHVDVQEIGARAGDDPDLVLEAREIGGEDRRADAPELGVGPGARRSLHLRLRGHGRS